MKRIYLFFWVLVLLGLGLAAILYFKNSAPSQKSSGARICFGQQCFSVETAQTDQQRARGLMGRAALPADQGMLFIFNQPGIYTFWMDQTLIPLDLIWLDQNRKIVYERANAQPCLRQPCELMRSGDMASYVLEINGGLIDKFGIKIGDVASISL